MKVQLVSKNTSGLSVIEIIIALALLITIIVGAVETNISSQYWLVTARIETEAVYKAKAYIEATRAFSEDDFQSASSTAIGKSYVVGDSADFLCTLGSLCYFVQNNVTDISSCSKYVDIDVSWRMSIRYPTTSVVIPTYLTNYSEIIRKGGDCSITLPLGDWLHTAPTVVGSQIVPPVFSSAVDVFQSKIYVISSTSPQLRIYSVPSAVGLNPILIGTSSVYNKRLNGLDVAKDMYTGRVYAYLAQHSSTSQLAIVDVTDPVHPVPILERTLSGVVGSASFPQGWRVFVYGNRLYVTTRETAGPELHVFDITVPSVAYEIITAAVSLNRTVNDMVVREQVIGGVKRQDLFLAASSDLKELSIYDVTSNVSSEVASFNLPGSEDASSIFLNGNSLYLGRKSGSGPELFVFDIPSLISGFPTPRATSEVGADVHTLLGAGLVLYLGTSKSGAEFQVWNIDSSTWSTATANTGRVSSFAVSRLAPHGIDIGLNYLYLQSQSATQPEKLTVVYTP